MKTRTLHMIGNAHLDPVWLWQWQEGYQEVKATFRSALDRMNEFEDFVFVASSAAFYEWVENSDPAMLRAFDQRQAILGQDLFDDGEVNVGAARMRKEQSPEPIRTRQIKRTIEHDDLY